ncbi:probable CCR4-associated factor 1 homolog 11 [Zingiber officinale]|uniref:probable CCR4-associated factor 1 homolog 11 n=1 Tax=Zingiber officinale TaxID=94328 RepID=UPI001C4B20D2|nr:probable CCR4-associated factor 1 homolog 11 [Zingiber officinale]
MAVAVVNNNDMLISSSAFSTSASRVEVRSVWAHNLDEEFALIRSVVPFHPFVALDTEYPGVVVASKNPYCTLTLSQRYELIRANVEALRIVQAGLTLSDAAGNLPCAIYSDGTCVRYVWEFNFRDFDISRDRYAPSSVELLKANGIDFQKNQVWGIDSCRFAQHLATSGLLSFGHFSSVSWVTFQGAYDFAFLVKMLTCDCKLPKTVHEFLHLVHFFFGKRVFDVKHLSKHCPGLYGGLERVASTVRVERAVGSRHQSGSDSLLTWQVFYQIRRNWF